MKIYEKLDSTFQIRFQWQNADAQTPEGMIPYFGHSPLWLTYNSFPKESFTVKGQPVKRFKCHSYCASFTNNTGKTDSR